MTIKMHHQWVQSIAREKKITFFPSLPKTPQVLKGSDDESYLK